ncbi:hypothetical protein CANTEDRAFT_115728 [Yamadazyma tenuis ATCC 10573]|uniref:Uncharacterized protein n=1 Tax=Candida tenuis (strain ATCC 10573 / BCRC 21748 / CBS 615 / JCM 9827 / NBRC 10315 / NRRL Y-1498 / VKM Y-70) TaxID=590646 RepID=G3B7G2_CANTC|nr:uncharacterized protein CANTEDRAFT_115728 [Yamadazyma tenuis ATCC 10573]EGV62270.1 hypothetical protein CANTEDRAFT_115728 [Yamadazyma tenuis ATCC 10573]
MFKQGITTSTPVLRRGMAAPPRASYMSLISVPRAYSVKAKWNAVNKSIDKIGDESTTHSKIALKLVRALGGLSVIAVICSLIWNSQFVDQPAKPEVKLGDLQQDIRKQ